MFAIVLMPHGRPGVHGAGMPPTLHSMAEGSTVYTVNRVPPQPFPGPRPSASADASRAAERKRLLAMTVEQRIREALSLHRQFQELIAEPGKYPHGTRS